MPILKGDIPERCRAERAGPTPPPSGGNPVASQCDQSFVRMAS